MEVYKLKKKNEKIISLSIEAKFVQNHESLISLPNY